MSNPTRAEVEGWLIAFEVMHDTIKQEDVNSYGMPKSLAIGNLALRALDMRDELKDLLGGEYANMLSFIDIHKIIKKFDGGNESGEVKL